MSECSKTYYWINSYLTLIVTIGWEYSIWEESKEREERILVHIYITEDGRLPNVRNWLMLIICTSY